MTLALVACSTTPETAAERKALGSQVEGAIALAKSSSPHIAGHFKDAYAYAVLPSVGKGAIGVGGAYGKGQVFQGGSLVGYCDMSQGSIGLQLGGQAFSEFIFFQNKAAFQKLLNGQFAFAANASAVAAEAGAAAANDYTDGVAVFLTEEKGLMFEAAIGGQQFNYRPLSTVDTSK
jgi:lipid-binding SYLF domain-containing protein